MAERKGRHANGSVDMLFELCMFGTDWPSIYSRMMKTVEMQVSVNQTKGESFFCGSGDDCCRRGGDEQ